MEREQDRTTTGGPMALVRRVPAWARILVIAVVAVAVLTIAFDLGTASPRLCRACHEMQPRAESWSRSAHNVVGCVECHQPPTEWYELPVRVIDRAALLSRDIGAHYSGDFADPVDAPISVAEPVPDEVCLQCHDANRTATSGYRILIDHAAHAERNGSCVSCHVRTAHPIASRGTALSLMGQCYTCHGTTEYPDAPTRCGACHPDEYELLPTSHTEARWADGHGDVSQSDEGLCSMCHERSFCDDCHGVAMPHPDDWAAGDQGHAVAAETDRTVCERCHGAGPDMCTMCHHTSYDPTQGTWIAQHNLEVAEEGSEYCLKCHPGPYCSFCHTALVEGGGPE